MARWTTPANADAYEALLNREIFPGIVAKNGKGFEQIELFNVLRVTKSRS